MPTTTRRLLTSKMVVACSIAMTGCTHYISSYDRMELDVGFIGDAPSAESLLINTSPEVTLRSQGCGRRGGLVAPPVILELVFPANTDVEISNDSHLVKDGKNIAPKEIRIVRGYLGGDRIELVFMTACSTLEKAELHVKGLKLFGQSKEIRPIAYRHSSRRIFEVNKVQDNWWK